MTGAAASQPAKVAHLTTVDISLRYLLWAQLDALRQEGVDVIGISAGGPHADWLEAHGVRHVSLAGSTRSMDVRSDLRAARALWRILRDERPDVLHTHNPKPGVYGRIIGRLAGVPVIVNTVHGLYATTEDSWLRRAWVYAAEAVASRFSDIELYQNAEDFELVTRWRISPPSKTVLLGNGVDLARFRPPTPAERLAARDELGVRADDLVIGFVGRQVVEKGLPELLAALRRMDSRSRLVVVGPHDPEKPDAIDVAPDERTLVVGERGDVERMYHAFDVLCLPSHREGFPRAPMEAAASGLPVVVTDVRGCRQVVRHGETGFLVPPSDSAALQRALEMLRDPERRSRMGRAARLLAESSFDERAVVARVQAAYAAGRARRIRRAGSRGPRRSR